METNLLKKYFKYVIALFILLDACTVSNNLVLQPENYKHYVDYFNRMEDENIVQAIPNDSAWNWMKSNFPS